MNIPISSYRPFYSTRMGKWLPGGEPEDSDFFDEVNDISNGRYKYLIDECRSITDKNARSEFKIQKLRAFSVSCRCEIWRSRDNIISHSGLLNIDIDQTGNEHIDNWAFLRWSIGIKPFVVASFLSASGKGLSFVVRCLPEEHKQTFKSMAYELSKVNIIADKGVHDVTRLRFTSYDPGAIIKTDFESIPISRPSRDYLAYQDSKITPEYFPIGDIETDENFQRAINRASLENIFADGFKHTFLVSVAGWCRHFGMSKAFTLSMVYKYFSTKTDADIETPVNNVYRSYVK